MSDPISLSLSADHLDYVARDLLYALEGQIRAGSKLILIVGPAGVGKTSFVKMYVGTRASELFSEVHWVSAGRRLRGRALDKKFDALSTEAKPLLIIDEADDLDTRSGAALVRAVNEHPSLRIILISRGSVAPTILSAMDDASTLVLGGLSQAEFHRFLRNTLTHDHALPSELLLSQLYVKTGGNPGIAAAALKALRAGIITSPAQLVESVSGFAASGVLGSDGKPISKDSQSERRIFFDVHAANADILRLLDKEPDLLWKLPPRRFEELVAEMLEKQGYKIELTPASADGGFDMYAAKKDGIGHFLYLVECKRYTPPNKVGVEIVRALSGVVQSKQATAGAIVTTSYFTAGAEKFQHEQQHRMHLHDYFVLRRWVSDYTGGSGFKV